MRNLMVFACILLALGGASGSAQTSPGRATKHDAASAGNLPQKTEARIDQGRKQDGESLCELAQLVAAQEDSNPVLRVLLESVEGGVFCQYFVGERLLNSLRGGRFSASREDPFPKATPHEWCGIRRSFLCIM